MSSPSSQFLLRKLGQPFMQRTALSYFLGLTVLALVYALAGWLGKQVPYLHGSITLIWPPAGIAVAVLYRCGLKYWLGVFLGTLMLDIADTPFWAAVGIATGNSLSCILTVLLLRRFSFRQTFETQSDVLSLFVASLLASTLGAGNGVMWLLACDVTTSAQSGSIFLVWWLADVAGIFVFAPGLLAIKMSDTRWIFRHSHLGYIVLEWAGLLALIGLALVQVPTSERPWQIAFMFLPGLYLISIAIRHRVWLSSFFTLTYVALGILGYSRQAYLMSTWPVDQVLVVIWTWMCFTSGTTLMLSVVHGVREKNIAQLNRQVQRYRALAEDTPALVCRFTPDLRITYLNNNSRKFFGLDGDSLTVVPADLFEKAEELTRLLKLLKEKGDHSHQEILQTNAQGQERWLRWVARAILADQGRPIDYHAIGIDVTELRKAEEERRLIEQQMFNAQKLESLGLMAGGVAHDFNNILTSVLGNAEIIGMLLPDDSPVQEHLNHLIISSRRAADLTRQLLAYAGRDQLTMRPLSLNAVIRDTIDLVSVSIPRKVKVIQELNPNLPPIMGDETQLRQVILNLIINAGEAVGDRPGTITLQTQLASSSSAQSVVELRIIDTGAGMTSDILSRIFDPFFTTKFTGRGLGLAAVQGIVRGHQGTIDVISKPGVGTQFILRFPATTETPKEPLPSGSSTQVPQPIIPGVALVVDDEETIRAVAEFMLTSAGWQVITANNGVQALERIQAFPGELGVILLDVTMPEMDGVEVLARLRQSHPRLPVVLCTGYNRDALPPLPENEPAVLLQKPFRQSDLMKCIELARSATESR